MLVPQISRFRFHSTLFSKLEANTYQLQDRPDTDVFGRRFIKQERGLAAYCCTLLFRNGRGSVRGNATKSDPAGSSGSRFFPQLNPSGRGNLLLRSPHARHFMQGKGGGPVDTTQQHAEQSENSSSTKYEVMHSWYLTFRKTHP